MKKRTLIFEDLNQLSLAVLKDIFRIGNEAIIKRGFFSIVLSGGSTPETLYKLLCLEGNNVNFHWEKWHVFWGDERCVPSNSAESSYGQAKRLMLDALPINKNNIHPINGELAPKDAVETYGSDLIKFARKKFGSGYWPRFDLILLGLGVDGHTASLFPGFFSDKEFISPIIAVHKKYENRPSNRVTLTPLVFNAARNIFFLVSGSSKSLAVKNSIQPAQLDPINWPVHRIQPIGGDIHWYIDKKSAMLLAND